jgi:pimeloyl-ACP methyl ester carboxylesterase
VEVATRYVDSDGLSIAYQVQGGAPSGAGAPDLVLVPGFVSHVELIWERRFARVIVFDKRGQGVSDRPGRPPTLEESMDDLHAVMDAVGCECPAILGISEGRPKSALFAASHPGPRRGARSLRDLGADAQGPRLSLRDRAAGARRAALNVPRRPACTSCLS